MQRTRQPDAGPFTAMPQSNKRPLIDIVKTLENTIGAPPLTLRPKHHRNGYAGTLQASQMQNHQGQNLGRRG
ncbi:hypothetical protein JCM10599A_21970 [Paraburkholderia kururiensis]